MKDLLAIKNVKNNTNKNLKHRTKSDVNFADLLFDVNDNSSIKDIFKAKNMLKNPNLIKTNLALTLMNTKRENAKNINLLSSLLQDTNTLKAKFQKIVQNAKDMNEILPKRMQISNEEILNDFNNDVLKVDYGKELLDDLNFVQILDFVELLKLDKKNLKLNNFFKDIMKNPKIMQDFKTCANVKNLCDLAKEYKLGLKELTYKTILNNEYNEKIFEKPYPTLYANNFFIKTENKSIKINETKENKILFNNKTENILKTGKLNEILSKLDEKKPLKIDEEDNIKEDKIQHKAKTNQILNSNNIQHSNIKLSKEQIKSTIDNFVRDFKEEVEKFKSPIHRVSIKLNPKELGEINITMSARGNNLHINLNSSNQNTLNLFMQNQQEFKNSLVNMGFTGLAMNFSDKKEGSNQEQKNQKKNYENLEEIESTNDISNDGINVVLYKYI